MILAIDSSTRTAAACVGKNGRAISEMFTDCGLTHSATLLPMALQCLRLAGAELSDCNAIAVTVGPGSFTGVRIGISTAKGLAQGSGLPLIAVSSLYALACNYSASAENALLCPVFDARCGQVYNALFEVKNGRIFRLCDDRAITIGQLGEELSALGRRALIMGDATDICVPLLGNFAEAAPREKRFIHGAGLLAAAENTDPVDSDAVVPIYLRLSQAEREAKNREAKKMIVLAADHGGYELKDKIGVWLRNNGYDFIDCGTNSPESVDYPVYARLAAEKILSGECERGIICCGTGIGICMAANRIKGIRAAMCDTEFCAEMTRRHNDANILCLGGRTTEEELAYRLASIFLKTPFDGGERHLRRIKMLDE